MDNEKLNQNQTSEDKKKLLSECIIRYMGQLAIALDQVITQERITLYIHALSDMTPSQISFGFEKALKEFKPEFGKTFPSPAELREWAFECPANIERDSRRILDRPDKPEPGSEESRADFSKRLIAEMRAKIASGAYDMPKPDKDFAKMRTPAEIMQEKLAPSTIPADPAKRQAWAKEMAVKQGWKKAEDPNRPKNA